MSLNNIKFQVIESINENDLYCNQDVNYSTPTEVPTLKNLSIVKEILNINFDEITFKDAFFILQNLQNDLKNLI